MKTIEEGAGEPIAILNRNKPAFYCIPPKAYEKMLEKIDDTELARIIRKRKNQEEIEINLDEL